MKFTALTLLALGASTSAYVVPNNKAVEENAVEARMPGSGPLRASNLVAALVGRAVEARHHKGKSGKAAGGAGAGAGGLASLFGRDAQELTDEEDDAHWADLHTGDLQARHHKGKGGRKNNRREEELTEEEDDAHWADLHTTDALEARHHKGKGGKKNNRRDAAPEPHHKGKGKKNNAREAEPDIEAREPHHKGKAGGKAAGGAAGKAAGGAAGKAAGGAAGKAAGGAGGLGSLFGRDAEVEIREPHHKGKGKKNARDAEVEAREPHHKGKGKKKNN